MHLLVGNLRPVAEGFRSCARFWIGVPEQYAHTLVQSQMLLGHDDEFGLGADQGAGEGRVGPLSADVLDAVGTELLLGEGESARFRADPQGRGL
ncbi:hypothetical protein AB0D57_02840 [Streptomyces sp. NPDC048275]|uniref:hypothetical protein n=1 Tax=Streptomyces sp. NPDC048275 TaxID=3155629 RepID=UPI0033E50F89